MTKYLKKETKKEILKLYIEEGLGVSQIAEIVNEPKKVIKDHLEEQGFPIKQRYVGYVHGHIQFTDFYNSYEHQYVLHKELDIDIFTIKGYYVHHKNGVKTDNTFNNLWLFYDNSMHMGYHSLYEKGLIGNDIDSLYLYCKNRVEDHLSDIERDREQEVMFNQSDFDSIENRFEEYMELLKKVYRKQKKML